jgi:hypothetical protein
MFAAMRFGGGVRVGGGIVTRRAFNRLAMSGVDCIVEILLGGCFGLLGENLRYHQVRSREIRSTGVEPDMSAAGHRPGCGEVVVCPY